MSICLVIIVSLMTETGFAQNTVSNNTQTNQDSTTLWNTYTGTDGLPGSGLNVVLLSGDEEYRSEESMTQLARILSLRHGFNCTVLYALDPDTGEIDPTITDNIPGMEALLTADVCVISTRFRNLPDEQMKYFAEYVEDAKPFVGLRTATHAFRIPQDRKYAAYSFNTPENRQYNNNNSPNWEHGFGRYVLGETWIAHHGDHGRQATRGIIVPAQSNHPIVRGCEGNTSSSAIFGPTDVYRVHLPLPGDSLPLVYGQVLDGMTADSLPATDNSKNTPMMPIAWTKTYTSPTNENLRGRVFTSTIGAAVDMESPAVRRLIINGIYWAAGIEEKITPNSSVEIVGQYNPSWFGFGKHIPGLKPADIK